MDEVGESLLDNPFWHALVGPQRELAYGSGLARRTEVIPGAALERPDEAAFADLDALSAPGDELLVLMRAPLPLPEGWVRESTVEFDQYVCPRLAAAPAVEATLEATVEATAEATWLGKDDLADMQELVELTQPGPLFPGAMALGRSQGIYEDGRLVAMAGERCHPPGYREISTVCTLPACRGRGLASALTARLASDILASGETPFLHVASGNEAAARVYRRLGFTVRARVTLSHLRKSGA
ncbi:MAG: GNAT family N-acetyltransferase [Deinococcales bacterium]